MGIIYAVASIQALIFYLLLINKNQKLFADRILAAMFFMISIHLFIRYLFAIDILQDYPHLFGIHVGFPLLYGPLLYFYVDSLTNNQQHFRKSYYYHFIPFIVVIIALIPLYLQSAEVKLNIINGVENYPKKYLFIIVMQITSVPIYVVWIFLLLKRHKRAIAFNFSYTEKVELKWLKNLTLGFGGISLVVLIVYLLWELIGFQILFEKEHVIYIAITLFVFVMGYKGLKQVRVFDNDLRLGIQDIKARKESTNNSENKKTKDFEEITQNIEKLLGFMKDKKPYLEEKLRLTDVATAINIPHFKLTKIINEYLNTNFFNFVNAYRVELIKKKLLEPSNNQFTILSIAYECGFSSKASFNRIFKQMTKMTPSQYCKKSKLEL